jgi:hypothetical protein
LEVVLGLTLAPRLALLVNLVNLGCLCESQHALGSALDVLFAGVQVLEGLWQDVVGVNSPTAGSPPLCIEKSWQNDNQRLQISHARGRPV